MKKVGTEQSKSEQGEANRYGVVQVGKGCGESERDEASENGVGLV